TGGVFPGRGCPARAVFGGPPRPRGPGGGPLASALGGHQPALASAMPSPTYADTPSRTVAALIRIPFMGGVPSVRFVCSGKKPLGAEPVPRQPDSIGNAPQRAVARVKKRAAGVRRLA